MKQQRQKVQNVAVIAGEFPVASQTFVVNHVASVTRRGHGVTVFSRSVPDWSAKMGVIEECGLRDHTVCLAYKGSRLRNAVSMLSSTIRAIGKSGETTAHDSLRSRASIIRQRRIVEARGTFDVVHAHFGVHGMFAVELQEAGLDIPVITTFHGFDVTTLTPEEGRAKYRRLFERGAAFTFNSRFTRSKLVAMGCPEEKLVHWRMAIDLDRFPFRERQVTEVRPTRLITVARLAPGKGIDVIIKAVSMLNATRDVELVVVGGGSAEMVGQLELCAAQLGLRDRVHLVGVQTPEEVVDHLASADLFILASRTDPQGSQEAQGVVLQEAQASGLPVIASDIGGIAEGVLDGESAVLVPPDSPEELAHAIEYLLERPEQWRQMGRAGRAFVEQHYSHQKNTDQILEVYRRVVHGESLSDDDS